MIFSCAAHHLDEEFADLVLRRGDQGGRVAVPEAEETLDHAAAVMLGRAVVTATVPMLEDAIRQFVDIVHLADRHAVVGEMQHLVVHVRVEVALGAHHLADSLITPARPVVGGEHDLGLAAKTVQRLGDVFRPIQRVAHRGTAQRIDVVQRGDNVFRHPKCLQFGNISVHLPRRLGIRRVLENHPHAIDLEFFDGLGDVAVRRDQPRGTRRDRLAQTLADVAVGRGGQQYAVLIEQAAVHRVARIDVFRDREIHEIDRCDHGDFARTSVLLAEDAAHAAPVVAVGVRVNHRRDRESLADVFLEQIPCGAHGLRRNKRIKDDPARLAAHEGDVREVETAHLIDAGDHFIEAVVVVQDRLAEKRRVNAVEVVLLLQKLEPLHVPSNVASVGLDLHLLHRGDEAPLLLLEVALVSERQRALRLGEYLLGELRRGLALWMEMSLQRS